MMNHFRCGTQTPLPHRMAITFGGTILGEKHPRGPPNSHGNMIYIYAYLVGGLEHEFYFSIDWEFHHPN